MIIVTEQGDSLIAENITRIPKPASTTLTIYTSDGGNIAYTYTSATLALLAYQRLSAAMSSKTGSNLVPQDGTTPTFTSATPNAAVGAGTQVVIVGTNFTQNTRVFVGTIEATVQFNSYQNLTITIPSGLTIGTAYDLTVYNPNQGASTIASGAVTMVPSVVFGSVNPSSCSILTNLTIIITGVGFLEANTLYSKIKLDDGAGHTILADFIVPNDTTYQTTDPNLQITVPGTYTIYGSADGGTTWGSFALTIIAS